MKPIIGILANLTDLEREASLSERAFVSNAYINAVIKAGGVPMIIPVNTQEEVIKKQIELIDGLILSGGVDVNPVLYNEEPSTEIEYYHPDIDKFDLIAIDIAIKLNKPILGICRGAQILNVSQGGSLYQDTTHIEGNYIKHNQSTKSYLGSHTIIINNESKISDILGTEILVNSYHHQSVKNVGKKLMPIAYSKDGVVEAIEMKDKKFIVGVQWHPELMVNHDEKMANLFKKFINASCSENQI